MDMNTNTTMRKLKIEMAIIFILVICLCITTFALALEDDADTRLTFTTGGVNIILNGGERIVTENDAIAPGVALTKEFTVENAGTYGVYYRLFFSGMSDGKLMKQLHVTIRDKEAGEESTPIYDGNMIDLTRGKVETVPSELEAGGTHTLIISFNLPATLTQADFIGEVMSFDFNAEAVQAENNTNRDFNEETDPIDADSVTTETLPTDTSAPSDDTSDEKATSETEATP